MFSEAFTGAVLGGGLRIAPEVFKLLDARGQRKHEQAMQQIELEFTKANKARGGAPLAFLPDSALEGVREAFIVQQTEQASRRYRFVPLLAALVRPTVTWTLLTLYVVVRLSELQMGKGTYGPTDIELLASVLSFWFLGRVWERSRAGAA